MGSWKIVEILFPLIFCISLSVNFNKLTLLKNILPFLISAPLGSSFKILSADKVLPEPDSPTIAVVFPFITSRFIFFTTSMFLLNSIVRFCIENI